jgi:hypothetical protein
MLSVSLMFAAVNQHVLILNGHLKVIFGVGSSFTVL